MILTALPAASAARTSESISTSISIMEEICNTQGILIHKFGMRVQWYLSFTDPTQHF